jgi:choline dehydrogenase-like flavoprotein
MILDLNSKDSIHHNYDILIVGSGAAGISLALEFIHTPFKVLLIEGGSFNINNKNQKLYKVKNCGIDYADLSLQRARFFGGTTNFWGGTCINFDFQDFNISAARKETKWPISFHYMSPYIKRAKNLCCVDPNFTTKNKKNSLAQVFDLKFWQFSPFPFRFGECYRFSLESAKNITVLLNANLTGIGVRNNGKQVDSVEIKSLSGFKKKISAKYFILATGGIENPRLLLNFYSKNKKLNFLKNNNIGKYFAEHPTAIIGYLHGKDASKIYSKYKMQIQSTGKEIKPVIGFTSQFLKQRKLLNGVVAIWPIPKDSIAISRAKLLIHLIRRREFGLKLLFNFLLIIPKSIILLPHVIHRLKGNSKELSYLTDKFEVRLVTETAPNYKSYISLSNEIDDLGLRKASLNWALSNIDKKTFFELANATKREVEKMGEVELRLSNWITSDTNNWTNYINKDGFHGHHMGTTRMGISKTEAVVDKDCKVFGVKNLYIAGSSVFPTYSFANPTLTIVALAIRLADHLKNKIKN